MKGAFLMDRKLHFLESFSAKGSDGEVYKVCGYEHMVRDETVADGLEHWESTGEIEYRLDDGSAVEAHRDGTMRIVRTGVALTLAAEEHANLLLDLDRRRASIDAPCPKTY
jgi:hypothetical protein